MTMFFVVAVGLAAAVVVLVVSVPGGRRRPRTPVLWWIGFVLLGLDTLVHIPLGVGTAIAGGLGMSWLLVGTLAFAATLWLAFIRPDRAGWVLIGTAVGLPAILALGSAAVTPAPEAVIPVQVMLGLYSLPALVMGTLLVLSMKEFGGGAAASAAPSADRDVTAVVSPSRSADR